MATYQETALSAVAKSIKNLDDVAITSEYLKSGKAKLKQVRKLLWEILDDNGYELGYNTYRLKKKK